MSRGVENNACVISLNRFETTSRDGFGEFGSIQIQWSVRTWQNRLEPIPLSQCGQALTVFMSIDDVLSIKGNLKNIIR